MYKLYRMLLVVPIMLVIFFSYLFMSSSQVFAEDIFFYESKEGMQFMFDPNDIGVNKSKRLIYAMVTARSSDGRKVPFYCFFSTRENDAVFSTDQENWLPLEKWNDFHYSLLKSIQAQLGNGSGTKNQSMESAKPKQPVDIPLDAKTIAYFRNAIDQGYVGGNDFGGDWGFSKYGECRKVGQWHIYALATMQKNVELFTSIIEVDPVFNRMRFLEMWHDNMTYGHLTRVSDDQYNHEWQTSSDTSSPLAKYCQYLLENYSKIPDQN